MIFNKYMKHVLTLCCALVLGLLPLAAADSDVENVLEYRLSSELVFKLDSIKRVTFSVSPEVRYDATDAVTSGLLQVGASYKVVSFLSLSSAYRLDCAFEEQDAHVDHKFLLGATVKKDLDRFGTKFRIRYTNDADDSVSDQSEQLFRFKISSDYNIKNCKLTPKVGAELFQRVGDDEVYKYRYSVGVARKIHKGQYLELAYGLDFYRFKYKNKHIVSLNYKFKL